MDSKAIPDAVVDGVKHGRYSLLLGAGFSKSSKTRTGQELPLGGEVAEKLAKRHKLPSSYALAQLADAITEAELDSFLQEELRGCHASDGARSISSFVWRTIYTFNVDDVVDDCYRRSALQKLLPLTFKQPYQRIDDPGSLHAIYLHGSVNHPKDGYVFSMQQYGDSAARDSTWFTVLGDELTTSPFIVVGCTLAEPDLEYYLAKRGGLNAEGAQVHPSVFVTRQLDRVLEKRCERFGLVPIEATSDAFWDALAHRVGPRLTPLELVIPKLHDSFAKAPSDKALRVFFRQWLDASTPPPKMPTPPPALLRGTEPTWEHLARSEDVIRSTTKDLVGAITHWVGDSKRTSRTDVLFAPSGEGRSTVMMRAFLELSKSGIKSYYYLGQERLAHEEALEVFSALRHPVVMFVDSIAECAYQLASLCDGLGHAKVPFFVFGAERGYRWRFVKAAFQRSLTEVDLRPLTRGEASALVSKMRSEGLLGRNARRTNAEIASGLQKKDLFASIISICNDNRKLNDVIESEWVDIGTPEARSVYSLIALAHHCGYPLRRALLSRASGIPADQVKQHLSNLKGMVIALPPMGDYIETRHRRIAEEVVRHLPATQRFRSFVTLARALAPYVTRKAIKNQQWEARLAGRVLNFDETVKPLLGERSEQFYLDIKDGWGWNSRYWEQRALLELDREDDKVAIQFAEQAVGLERHPLPLTTLAKVQFATAMRVQDPVACLERVRQAVKTVDEAIAVGHRLGWREPHPFDVGIRGILDYLTYLKRRKVYVVDRSVKAKVKALMADAERLYSKDEYARLHARYEDLIIAFR